MTDTTLDGAELLATVDQVRYYRVAWIVAQQDDEPPAYYSAACAWPETTAGKLAARDQEIARLQSRLADLEQQLATQSEPPAVADAASGMGSAEPVRASPYTTAGHRARCPICDKKIWPSLLEKHLSDVHAAQPIEPAPELPPPPLSRWSRRRCPTSPMCSMRRAPRHRWCLARGSAASARRMCLPRRSTTRTSASGA